MSEQQSGTAVQRWLAVGAATGLIVAAIGVMGERPSVDDLPPGAVARVGDALIRVEEYDRLVAGLESDRRSPVDGKLRRHVLDRMIDEELLVQRAVELGLVEDGPVGGEGVEVRRNSMASRPGWPCAWRRGAAC